ncbi:NAD(P)/FAD-dependent oxidoreductase [Plantibacter sp. M259]|uniref:NAD(P)/FAD-dependent oxidoreductase n=1 Tax=Plantibacter sp. M259 TaxID=2583822 RepID=UPI001F0F2658|nr:NAD(P)/FAD-dependent oxidoreductase [Plantibacter sp. M259]
MSTPVTPATSTDLVDAVIVGGGAAGLSAAIMLGRSRRSVIVVDGGEPRNAPADGVHGFLTREGTPPRELLRLGRAEVVSYGVRIVDGQVVDAGRDGDGFILTTADGTIVQGRRLLIATGTADELPPIPGLWERFGRDALHCPYCHGWEVQDRVIGVLGTNAEAAAHQAQLFRQLSDRVVVLRNTAGAFTAEQEAAFAARGIEVVDGVVERLEIADDRLVGVRLDDGRTVPVEALAVARSTGCAPTRSPVSGSTRDRTRGEPSSVTRSASTSWAPPRCRVSGRPETSRTCAPRSSRRRPQDRWPARS